MIQVNDVYKGAENESQHFIQQNQGIKCSEPSTKHPDDEFLLHPHALIIPFI
jgi:hypothetical protein